MAPLQRTICLVLALTALYAAFTFNQMDCDWTTWHSSPDPSYFQDRVVWITGASSGIGEALAQHIASMRVSTKLILSARREHKLTELKQNLQNLFTNSSNSLEILVLPLDLSRRDTAYYTAQYQSILTHFNISAIDILVNNAGASMRSTLSDFAVDDAVDLLQINLVSPIVLSKLVLTDMMARGAFGHIVNVDSVISRLQTGYRTIYAASKSGLLGFGYSLREELRPFPEISVTDVLPGPVRTNVDIAARGKAGEGHGKRDAMLQNGMSTERCAELIGVAVSHRLSESWIARGQILGIVYASYYVPSLYDMFGRPRVSQRLGEAAGYEQK